MNASETIYYNNGNIQRITQRFGIQFNGMEQTFYCYGNLYLLQNWRLDITNGPHIEFMY